MVVRRIRELPSPAIATIGGIQDDSRPEQDAQAAHLFKHPHLGIEDINDAWASDPLFYPASHRRTG